jgi:hypothetical protein
MSAFWGWMGFCPALVKYFELVGLLSRTVRTGASEGNDEAIWF